MFDLQIARTKQRELRNESCDYVILNHAFHPGRGLGAARRAHGGRIRPAGKQMARRQSPHQVLMIAYTKSK
jgi:hypothetical protein